MFSKDPDILVPYLSYGTSKEFYAIGRALNDKPIELEKDQGLLDNLKDVYKLLESDEIRNAPLEIQLQDGSLYLSRTDKEGYYKTVNPHPDLDALADTEGWVSYQGNFENQENKFQGEMLIPSHKASFGIISDIDDTILQTGVTSTLKWQVVVNTLFKNFDQRLPLKNANILYQKLHLNPDGEQVNPFFYVSNSPWNLYPYLQLFLKEHQFPKGPILLRDFGSPLQKFFAAEKPHKQKEIRNILKKYPTLNFILIGDSGEHDPDIYIDIAKEQPDRILAIYLRNVNHSGRMERVQSLTDAYKDTPILMAKTSKEIEEHARAMGLIF